jgi:hypothetical protein
MSNEDDPCNGPPEVLPFRAATPTVQDAASNLMLWVWGFSREALDGELPDDVRKSCRVIQKWLEPDERDDDDDGVDPSPSPCPQEKVDA